MLQFIHLPVCAVRAVVLQKVRRILGFVNQGYPSSLTVWGYVLLMTFLILFYGFIAYKCLTKVPLTERLQSWHQELVWEVDEWFDTLR
jgi:hypothetical protein